MDDVVMLFTDGEHRGAQGTLKKFKHHIEEWSTKGKYFEADEDKLQTILDKLIKASCCNISRGKQNENTRFLHIADFKRRKPEVRICDINIKQGGLFTATTNLM